MSVFVAASLTQSDQAIILGIVLAWVVSAVAMKRSITLGSGLSSLFAFGSSVYLITQKYAEDSVCSGENTSIFDCDAVNQSEFSSIGPIPVATLGAAFFLAMFYVSWKARNDPDKYPRFGEFLRLMGGLSVAASLVMAIISFGVIRQVCPFCVSLYGFSIILLIGGLQTTRTTPSSEPDACRGTAISTFLVGIVVLYVGFTPSDVSGELDGGTQFAVAAVRAELRGDEPEKGNPDAPYTVVEFADFECPGCAALHPEMAAFIAEREDILLVFKNHPLPSHPNAMLAAKATVCAHQQGKFWELSDAIFDNQRTLQTSNSEVAAMDFLDFLVGPRQLDLDRVAWQSCMDDEATVANVEDDLASAEQMGVNATPSLFLHGVCEAGVWLKIDGRTAGIRSAIEAFESGASLPCEVPESDSVSSENNAE